jgi:hypothetical protein
MSGNVDAELSAPYKEKIKANDENANKHVKKSLYPIFFKLRPQPFENSRCWIYCWFGLEKQPFYFFVHEKIKVEYSLFRFVCLPPKVICVEWFRRNERDCVLQC